MYTLLWFHHLTTPNWDSETAVCLFPLLPSLLSGATDTFEFSSKHLGEIAGICLGHITKDGKKVKGEASWHIMEVVVTEKELGNKWEDFYLLF